MSGSLEGQVAIVTGGGRGIGQAIARGLAAEGAAVAVTARTASQLNETVGLIEAAGGQCLAISADVTNQGEVERLVAEAQARLGPIDVLVNNAGVLESGGPIWEIDPESWHQTIETNVFGPFLVSRAVLPTMVSRKQGRIINVSSGASVFPGGVTGLSAYGASKAALNSITETMASETKDLGISVFAIAPGVVHTEMLRLNFDPAVEKVAPGRAARMWEIDTPLEEPVKLCVYLASGRADALSGSFLGVNDDIAKLVQQAEAIRNQDLYTMRIKRLEG